MLPFFTVSNHTLFETLLDLILDSRFPMNSHVSATEHTDLVENIKRKTRDRIFRAQRTILLEILPGASCIDPSHAADELIKFGNSLQEDNPKRIKYYDKAAALYEQFANLASTSTGCFGLVTFKLRELGPRYYATTAAIYERLANHANASLCDITQAADGMGDIGNRYPIGSEERIRYHTRAEELFELVVIHQNVKPVNISNIVHHLIQLGNHYPAVSKERIKYYNKAMALNERLTTHPDASAWDIIFAADKLRKYGDMLAEDSEQRSRYHDKAAMAYERVARSQNIPNNCILSIAEGFHQLGKAYHDKAAAAYERLANLPDIKPEFAKKAAQYTDP